jgi:hypothetical protein
MKVFKWLGVVAASYVVGWGVEVLWKRIGKEIFSV